MKKYRVIDPKAVYPVYAVEVMAKTKSQARMLALEAMMGCSIKDVDSDIANESLSDLIVEELGPEQ
jgi:hypothetical protein